MAENNKTTEELTAEKAAEAKRIEKAEEARVAADKKAEEKTVTLSQDQFDLLVNEINSLKKGQKDLEDTSSPDQIKRIEAIRAKGGLVKSVKIAEIDGKLVSSWKSTADEVYIDHALGKEVSSQMTELHFFDGGKKDMSQSNFARVKIMKTFEVIKEGKDKVGNILLTLTKDDGEEFEVDSRYIN